MARKRAFLFLYYQEKIFKRPWETLYIPGARLAMPVREEYYLLIGQVLPNRFNGWGVSMERSVPIRLVVCTGFNIWFLDIEVIEVG